MTIDSGSAAPPTGRPPRHEQLSVPKTKVSRAWVAITAGLLLLLFIITFIWQNQQRAKLNFLWFHGTVPIGLTILLSFVVGGVLVGLLGTLRLGQLRHMANRHRRADRALTDAR